MLNKVEPFSSLRWRIWRFRSAEGKENIVVGVKRPEGAKDSLFGQGKRDRSSSDELKLLSGAFLERELLAAKRPHPRHMEWAGACFIKPLPPKTKSWRFSWQEEAMVFSSAYSTVVSILPARYDRDCGDKRELNHNCIINVA